MNHAVANRLRGAGWCGDDSNLHLPLRNDLRQPLRVLNEQAGGGGVATDKIAVPGLDLDAVAVGVAAIFRAPGVRTDIVALHGVAVVLNLVGQNALGGAGHHRHGDACGNGPTVVVRLNAIRAGLRARLRARK